MIGIASCGRERRPAASAIARAERAAMDVGWAGCAVVRPGPRCEMGSDRVLTVWIPRPDLAGWRFATDGRPLTPTGVTQVQEGTRLVFEVPGGARSLGARNADGQEVWALALGEAASHAEIDQLLATGRAGKHRESSLRLKEIAASGPPAMRGPADAAYGRLQLALADMDEAEPAFRRSIAAARADGRLSDAVLDGNSIVWGLTELRQRFADARALSGRAAARRGAVSGGPGMGGVDRRVVAVATGNFRDALASYREAQRTAERLGRERSPATPTRRSPGS